MATLNLTTTNAIQNTFGKLNIPEINLKLQQVKVFQYLIADVDAVAVLPTGYGKSILFQELPFMNQQKHVKKVGYVVIPLNSIIPNQLKVLKRLVLVLLYYMTSIIQKSQYLFMK